MSDDRSKKVLLARRELAEKATSGEWKQDEAYRVFGMSGKVVPTVGTDDDFLVIAEPLENAANDTAHIAASNPETVMADIDEIISLRAQVKRLEKRELRWTKNLPKKTGYYWWKEYPKDEHPQIVRVSYERFGEHMVLTARCWLEEYGTRLEDMRGFWAGPIREPK